MIDSIHQKQNRKAEFDNLISGYQALLPPLLCATHHRRTIPVPEVSNVHDARTFHGAKRGLSLTIFDLLAGSPVTRFRRPSPSLSCATRHNLSRRRSRRAETRFRHSIRPFAAHRFSPDKSQ
jgi:hypothetical protein